LSSDAERRWVADSGQVSSQVEGETVILHMPSGTYFGLDRVGSAVWELLSEPRTLGELRDAVVARFEVEPDQAEQDLRALLADLEANGLVS
jgi:hypothetical protein